MIDERIKKLAHNLVNFSCALKPGENLLIDSKGDNEDLVRSIIREVYAAGGNPYVWQTSERVQRELALGCTEAQQELRCEVDSLMMSKMQAYIAIRGGINTAEMCDVPSERTELMARLYSEKVHSDIRVPHTKWVVLRYPSAGMAMMANMSTEAFEDYFFNVCNLDYSKMDKAMDALKALMEKTDKVHLKGPGTDLKFSIKGNPAIKCAGECNIPDGEIYTAPVKTSVNGVVSYNTPSLREGFTFENIVLTFKDGKIIDAKSNDTARINKIFDMDDGARYVGEFAIGVNPFITFPMKDTLFDEKICGSFHFTPGACYDECPNGNSSALHWDLVCIQRAEYGGGEMYFDDVLVRKDGLFVLPELLCLNPDNLK